MAKKVNYRIISAKDFLKAKPSGQFDREESMKILVKIVTFIKSSGDYDILLDIREAFGSVTYLDIYDFVAELKKHRNVIHNKIAVLSREDGQQFDNVQFMELCAKNRGLNVGVFTSYESTINWLATSCEIEINNPSIKPSQ